MSPTVRIFSCIIAAVVTSLVIPVGLLLLAVFPPPPPEEGDAYVRAALSIGALLPIFAACLTTYHSLGLLAVRALQISPSIALLALSVLASAVFSALFLASGAPLSWDRLGDFGVVMALLWVPLALGSSVQYFVCFKTRPRIADCENVI
jgi:hypothetical protein